MGCDIHLFTERKRSINSEEKWVNADNWKLNPYYDGQDKYEKEYQLNKAYRGRNYSLFSILADVRNYSSNKPICEPRGLPEDVSYIIKTISDDYGSDGHSHSWLTMKELYDYFENNKTVKYSGLVDPKGVQSIERGEMPDWWCQDSSMKNLTWKEWEHENDVILNFIETLERHFKSEYYKKEEADKFRIVFFFDN